MVRNLNTSPASVKKFSQMEATASSKCVLVRSLPTEIITEILLRLPVKSLLKFRCVCKSWLILISSSQFIKTHLNISTKSNNYNLILISTAIPKTLYICPLSYFLSNTVMDNSRAFDFPMSVSDYELWFVGCCNGLLCISIDPETLVLYNPSIKKLKTLPVSGTDLGSTLYLSYGFCYDDTSEDYKVVELNIVSDQASMCCTELKVYSLRNNSWRRIGDDQDGRIDSSGGKYSYVGRVLHWRICLNDGSYVIFAVNAVTNMYGTLEPPKDDGKDGVAEWSLGEINGCLGVFYDYYKIRLDVWAMKEYGIKESWTRVMSIAYPVNPNSHLWPLFELETDEFCFEYEPNVMLYNSKNNSFTTREVHNVGGLCSVATAPYIESLVPPNIVGE